MDPNRTVCGPGVDGRYTPRPLLRGAAILGDAPNAFLSPVILAALRDDPAQLVVPPAVPLLLVEGGGVPPLSQKIYSFAIQE